jgi:hypothetical protein
MTKIIQCSYEHKFQDEKHGKGNRVANWAPKQDGWRCTVCGKIHKRASAKAEK